MTTMSETTGLIAQSTTTMTYWDGFSLFHKELLDDECLIYEELAKALSDEWEKECAKYEETMTVKFDGKKKKKVPRRNYINKDALIQDTSLFPYHSSCYALLDAYDNLYKRPRDQPVSRDAVPAHCFPPHPVYPAQPRADDDIAGYLPCSFRSIAASIFRLVQIEGLLDAEEGLLGSMDLLVHSCVERCVEGGMERPTFQDMLQTCLELLSAPIFVSSPLQCGPCDLPGDTFELRKLLLKLLKHALSEIQRDHILAMTVMSRLFAEGHLEDIGCLRRVLVVLASEFVTTCESPCDEPEDHVCAEWVIFRDYLFRIFGNVSIMLTQDHGMVLAAFVRHLFLREFGHLAPDANHSFGEKLKNELKRNLIVSREEYDERETEACSSSIPTELVMAIVTALRRRACLEMGRMRGFLDETCQSTSASEEKMLISIQSYRVCLSALVSIADGIVTLLPPVERFYAMSSGIVQDITISLLGRQMVVPESYMGSEHEDLESFTSPFRFADTIRQAATLRAQRSFPTRSDHSPRENALNQCRQIVFGRPPDEIREVVRKIFVRDMVHLQETWFGYGDFLIWCRYEVDPLDPVLLCHEFNYHIDDDDSDDDDDDSDDDDESEEETKWDVDEEGNLLSPSQLGARFDFSLLALQCAWREPWTAASHTTFQPGFQIAVHQVALCLQRFEMPRELHGHIVQYFSRDWWPDPRSRCFYYECMLEQVRLEEESRAGGDIYVSPPVKFCECGVAAYCSRACREADWKGGHRRCCGRPPFCRPTVREYRFCQVIRALKEGNDVIDMGEADTQMLMEDDDDGDDDDGSWESVDSHEDLEEAIEEETPSITSRIVEFFKPYYKDR